MTALIDKTLSIQKLAHDFIKKYIILRDDNPYHDKIEFDNALEKLIILIADFWEQLTNSDGIKYIANNFKSKFKDSSCHIKKKKKGKKK